MSVRFRFAVFALGIALLPWGTVGAQTEDDPRTGQVERGLQTTFYLAGRPRQTHTLAARMQYYKIPAVSIAVIDRYRVVWARAYGYRDLALRAPAQKTTLFQAASMSKPVFAAAAIRLFADRHLSLDANVDTLLRSWRLQQQPNIAGDVTMRRILSHTAGINVHGFEGYDRNARIPTLVQVLDGKPPANSEAIRIVKTPGGKAEYSGGGTTIGQQVAIDVSGLPFPAFMQQTLLGPLGMTNSTYVQPLPEAQRPRAATGYSVKQVPVRGDWHVYPEMAAAGLWTTPSDLAKFVIAIENGLRGKAQGPITPFVAREMTTPVKPGAQFALGPEVGSGFFRHTGANDGFQGEFVGLTQGGRGVVIMTNSDAGLLIVPEIVASVAAAYDWPALAPTPKTAITLDRAQLLQLVGTYRAGTGDDAVTIAVRFDGTTLTLEIVGYSPGAPLYPQSRTQFFSLDGNVFTAAFDVNGRARSLTVAGSTFDRV